MALLKYFLRNRDPDNVTLKDVQARDRNGSIPAFRSWTNGDLDPGDQVEAFAKDVDGYASIDWHTFADGHDMGSNAAPVTRIAPDDVVDVTAGSAMLAEKHA